MTTAISTNYQHSVSRADDHDMVKRFARPIGWLYLVLAIVGMFSVLVFESILEHGDAAMTVSNLKESGGLFGISLVTWVLIISVDIALAVVFHIWLEPINRSLSLLTAVFRLSYAVVLGAILAKLFDAYLLTNGSDYSTALDASVLESTVFSAMAEFRTGFSLALILFGVHLIGLGILLFRSRYIPAVIGIILAVAGVGYVVDSFASFLIADYSSAISMIVLAPAIVGEFGLTGWLLLKGARNPQEPVRD